MFDGMSFLQFVGLQRTVLSFTDVEMIIKPNTNDGLIFYNGYVKRPSGDFIALTLKDGFVEFRFDLGTGPAYIRCDSRTRSYVLRMFPLFFICQLTFCDDRRPTFLKLFHMTWLKPPEKRCYADYLKMSPNDNEGRKPQILPNFASNRNILSAITRDVEGK